MLFRLLLTVSLFGVWSLPAFGNGGTWENPLQVSGGGKWYDNMGRVGIFDSQLSTLYKKVKDCRRGLIGCYEIGSIRRYSIEIDDGRTEWFAWSPNVALSCSSSSGSGAVKTVFVGRTRRADPGHAHAITIVDGDYTLTLLEGKIKGVPGSITYGNPRSNLFPRGKRCRDYLLE